MQKHLNPFECSQFDDAGIKKTLYENERNGRNVKIDQIQKSKVVVFEEEIQKQNPCIRFHSNHEFQLLFCVVFCSMFLDIQFSKRRIDTMIALARPIIIIYCYSIQKDSTIRCQTSQFSP